MAYVERGMRDAAFHFIQGFRDYVGRQCAPRPTVNGQVLEFQPGGDRVEFLLELSRNDLFLFGWKFLSMGMIVMVTQSRSTDEEDAHSAYFISGVPFRFMCNDSTDPETASMRLSKGVNMAPNWVWNKTTHQGLPSDGRRRAVFLCLALKRMGLPPLCSMVVLQMCEQPEFGAGLLHVLPLYDDDPVEELIDMDPHFFLSVNTLKSENGYAQPIRRPLVWTP